MQAQVNAKVLIDLPLSLSIILELLHHMRWRVLRAAALSTMSFLLVFLDNVFLGGFPWR